MLPVKIKPVEPPLSGARKLEAEPVEQNNITGEAALRLLLVRSFAANGVAVFLTLNPKARECSRASRKRKAGFVF
jgi:hypothetical protein